jgi:hypothetical protein
VPRTAPPIDASDKAVDRLYRARQAPELVDVPELGFLMIDGRGAPGGSEPFQVAIQVLYGVSYTLKFALARACGRVYRVSPLEALWWAEDGGAFPPEDESAWRWTAMVRQPPEVTSELAEEAAREVAEKKRLPEARELRLERFVEGRAAQVLHVGPYADEAPTIERLHAFASAQGYALRGRHHEIYLGDPRRAAPERLKTIIRQPVEPRA